MTTPTTMTPLTYGKVVGRFLALVGDGADADDFPDVVALTGTVTFTPAASAVLVATANPAPATLLPAPIPADVDTNGYVSYNGKPGVFLLAPSPDTNPPAWTWHVEFRLKLDNNPVNYGAFDFTLPPYVTAADAVDLTLVARVPSSAGAGIVRGPAGLSVASARADGNGNVIFTLNDVSHTELPPVPLPPGPPGPPGTDNRAALARTPDTLIAGTVTRDTNGAATSAPVVWPDSTAGTYTTDTLSTAFPGAVDAYHITYGAPVTKTYTQPLVTRDANGAATSVPAIAVS